MALILALGTLMVLSMTATTILFVSTSNERSSTNDKRSQVAFALAEAGLNNALAVLNLPTNNALDEDTIPACAGNAESNWNNNPYEGGETHWCGDLIWSESAWRLKSKGVVQNGNALITRLISAYVPIQPVVNQLNNNPAWNYVMATNTGTECDMLLNENITFESALFVHGSLCLNNNANIRVGPVIVKGTIKMDNNGSIGTSSTPISVAVGGLADRDNDADLEYCKAGNSTQWSAASAQDCDATDRIYGTGGVNTTPPVIAMPTADWETWYEDAIPGPATPCTSDTGAASGAYPTFDNDFPTMSSTGSVPTAFNLTPGTSYTCRVGSSSDPYGELSWDASTRVLTIRGTIFIDGSMYANNGLLNSYSGQGTLYLRGTFLLDNNTKLCGGTSGSNCDYGAWDPNTELFTIISNGNGGQVPTGNSIQLDNSSQFQGALFATNGITLSNNASSDGPMLAGTITVSQNFTADDFGTILTVPPGMPGNPQVYAQPNAPQRFSG
jgi:hypothetical protein